MEYCIQLCSPCYMKDVVKLESVQKRFTRILPELEGLSYRERLNSLGLFSLEYWKLRFDLIEVYKIMRSMEKGYGMAFEHEPTLHSGINVAVFLMAAGHKFDTSPELRKIAC
eukprot:g39000.t1